MVAPILTPTEQAIAEDLQNLNAASFGAMLAREDAIRHAVWMLLDEGATVTVERVASIASKQCINLSPDDAMEALLEFGTFTVDAGCVVETSTEGASDA